MAHALHDDGTRTEPCEQCEAETPHDVSVELKTEGSGRNKAFSREPYRVAVCTACGDRSTTRMNDQ